MEHTAANQHVYLAGLCPVQQIHDQIRNILWKRTEMQNMSFAVYHTHRTSAEHTGFLDQTPRHNAVGSQQIFRRIRIKFIKPLINLKSVFDLGNIFGRSQNMLAVQNSSYLLQRKGVLLNCQRPMYGADSIATAQSRV